MSGITASGKFASGAVRATFTCSTTGETMCVATISPTGTAKKIMAPHPHNYMKTRSPIPKISQRRLKQRPIYERKVRAWWRVLEVMASLRGDPYPLCYWPGCRRPALRRPHHLLPRSVRPDLICDPLNFAGTCQEHHDHAHRHPAEAYAVGFMGRSTDSLAEVWVRLWKAQENKP